MEEPAAGGAVRQLAEGVVHQDEPKARERVPLGIVREAQNLTIGQPELAGIVVIAAEPGGVEPDQVDGKAPARHLQGGTVAEPAVGRPLGVKLRTPQDLSYPVAIATLSSQDLVSPAGLDPKGRRPTGQPTREPELVHLGTDLPEALPGRLVDGTLDVVVPRDDEEAIGREVEALQESVKELSGLLILLAEPPIRRVPGEADEVDRSILEQFRQIAVPGLPEHPAAAPGFLLPRPALVQVGDMEQA